MRETILLVEDEAGIRALVRKILARERYRVLEAASGEEALSIAQAYEDPIHLLLTDVMMPGMGGQYVAEALRSKLPELRVVCYISTATPTMRKCARVGFRPDRCSWKNPSR